MFRGYFDESLTHGIDRYAVLGGFVGESASWLRFDDPWRGVLKEFGLSHFRTADWTNRQGEFEGWPLDKKERCMNALLKLIANRGLISVGVLIPMTSYDTLPQAVRRWTSPHGLAAQCLFSAVAELFAADDPHGKVAYLLESGTEGSGAVKRAYDYALTIPKAVEQYHLAPLEFGDKKLVPALQAADIAAYELGREGQRAGERGRGETKKQIRYPLRQLRQIEHYWFSPSEKSFRILAESITLAGLVDFAKAGQFRRIA